MEKKHFSEEQIAFVLRQAESGTSVAENVKPQISHRQNLALIKNQHAKGPLPRIHGWLYRVEDGTIEVLVDGRKKQANV